MVEMERTRWSFQKNQRGSKRRILKYNSSFIFPDLFVQMVVDDFQVSRLAVDDLHGSLLVNAELLDEIYNLIRDIYEVTNIHLEEWLKCFLKCCISMKLPTFLFIKMRRRPLEFIIAYGRSKDKRKAIESRHANHKTDHKQNYYRSFLYKDKLGLHLTWKKTSSEDFLEVVWKTSWKSSGRLPGSRLEDFLQVLPNKEKSDIKTYQNVQICYERETSPEDIQEVHKTSWKSSSALYFRRLTGKSSQKSSRSEKPAYPNPDLKNMHIQKRSNGLKTEKNERQLRCQKVAVEEDSKKEFCKKKNDKEAITKVKRMHKSSRSRLTSQIEHDHDDERDGSEKKLSLLLWWKKTIAVTNGELDCHLRPRGRRSATV
ncbi:hypothetical protein YC2023_060170 [Brassica napus]